jgi:uncharacterized protein (DUF2249 family)
MSHKTVTIDVRDDIRFGQAPFSRIMNAANDLGAGEELLIIAPFEPAPLFSVMQRQGFSYTSRPMPSGDWEVLFTRNSDALLPASDRAAESSGPRSMITEVVEVDARGLEPPQPMVKILETLAGLAQGTQLDARTDRRPMHLYPQLEERGYVADTKEQSDGSFLTHIRRR